MNILEDVPFQTTLGPLEEKVKLVTAPDLTTLDCQPILRETEVVLVSSSPAPILSQCLLDHTGSLQFMLN